MVAQQSREGVLTQVNKEQLSWKQIQLSGSPSGHEKWYES